MVLFHSEYRSERLNYVLNYVFKERFGLEFERIDSLENVSNSQVIFYNTKYEKKGLHIQAQGLLFEIGINQNQDIDFFINPFIHHTDKVNSYPDIFSAIFFHLSRYEEYYGIKDSHGRFDGQNSCLFLKGKLQTPWIDVWLIQFKKVLIDYFKIAPESFKKDQFQIVAGIDIDSVFTYKGKGMYRQLAALSRDLFSFNWHEIKYRISVLLGIKKDPNDNFHEQAKFLGNRKATYFIQVGPYGKFDKNLSPNHPEFIKIIQELRHHGHQIAMHPSYQSYGDMKMIQIEKLTLENLCLTSIDTSRQHFLRFQLPQTFRDLIQCGIKTDCSMGYSEYPGFRAATAFSFTWYDLKAEKSTVLELQPFSVMDVSYKHFLKFDIEKTIQESGKIKEICKELNAPFQFVFHNESLSGHRGWEGWERVFQFWNNE